MVWTPPQKHAHARIDARTQDRTRAHSPSSALSERKPLVLPKCEYKHGYMHAAYMHSCTVDIVAREGLDDFHRDHCFWNERHGVRARVSIMQRDMRQDSLKITRYWAKNEKKTTKKKGGK